MNYVLVTFLVVCIGAVVFLLYFLIALCRDKNGTLGCEARPESGAPARESGGRVVDLPTIGDQPARKWWSGRWAPSYCDMRGRHMAPFTTEEIRPIRFN